MASARRWQTGSASAARAVPEASASGSGGNADPLRLRLFYCILVHLLRPISLLVEGSVV